MKKYLMTGIAALVFSTVFVGCSKDKDLYDNETQASQVLANYEQAFIRTFGQPSPDQNWGFGPSPTTRAASAGNYESSTNANLFSDWSDRKTYVTCDEGEAVAYQITYSLDDNHPATNQIEVLAAYSEVLPEGQNNISKVAETNKEEFVTTAAGEISYIVLPGITAGTNDRIGYYYYTTSCNIKTLHKYVLTNDPSSGFLGDGEYVNFNDANGEYAYTGWEKKFKEFKLVYVDENGNASYEFPAGVNVGFFTQTTEAGSKKTVELYSNGSLNQQISNWLGENSYDGAGWANSASNSHVAIFSYKGYNFVGFEDWYDYDYNDMVLSVVGNISPARTVNNLVEETPSLHVMAEDLSAEEESDFDFNDVVIDVYYVDKNTVTINLLATGATLPIRICADDSWEVHGLFDVPVTTMVNTGKKYHTAKAPYAQEEVLPMKVLTYKGFSDWSKDQDEFAVQVRDQIKLEVEKDGVWCELKAEQGRAASKVATRVKFHKDGWYEKIVDPAVDAKRWPWEKQSIGDGFKLWVQDPYSTWI